MARKTLYHLHFRTNTYHEKPNVISNDSKYTRTRNSPHNISLANK